MTDELMSISLTEWLDLKSALSTAQAELAEARKVITSQAERIKAVEDMIVDLAVGEAFPKERIETLEAALNTVVEGLTCGDDGGAHYCPNCDRSLYKLRALVARALNGASHGD